MNSSHQSTKIPQNLPQKQQKIASETSYTSSLPALAIENLSFSYPVQDGVSQKQVLEGVNLSINKGDFALLVGGTGSGKTTLLRLCKNEIAPLGDLQGSITIFGQDIQDMDVLASTQTVGYVFQNPEAQIVCDTVWHEMAFGLENLGIPDAEMHRRIAETCYFFGMEPWFRAHTAELSGGRRQLLALAATLAMRPKLLLLDEPTSMLDPLAAHSFISMLYRVNRELGITVVVATHEPELVRAYATCAFEVKDKKVRACALDDIVSHDTLVPFPAHKISFDRPALSLSDVWYRYTQDSDWTLRGINLNVAMGEVHGLVGGNGCGKSTLLNLVSGVAKAQRGRVKNALYQAQAYLPQNPKSLLSKMTIEEELMEWADTAGYTRQDMLDMLEYLGLCEVLSQHPFDLSGGQQQLVATIKLLLVHPRLLLCDEPTKGLDSHARKLLGELLFKAREEGTTILMVTHDMSFARATCDRISMLFDGQITLTQDTKTFIEGSWLWK